MSGSLRAYYAALAPHYDALPNHRSKPLQAVARAIARALRLEPDDLLADLCCGTGLVARELLRQVPLRSQIVAVDASEAMLDRVDPGPRAGIRLVHMDAMSFAEFPVRYDKILIKDAITDVPDAAGLLRALRARLGAGGRLLVADLAPESQGWLFKEARRRWESLHPRPEETAALLGASGFEAVAVGSVRVRQRLSLEDLATLVEKRWVPVLASFDDADLRKAVDELRERGAAVDGIDQVQRFDLVTGLRGGCR